MPFSTPPAPSEPPKSRILAPLTGSANKPLAEAKAIAGLSRAGSFSAPRLGLPLRATGAPCRLAVAAALRGALQVLLHFGDQALQAVDLAGQRDGARAFRLHVLFDRALLALPLVDQGGEPGLVVPQLVAVRAPAGRARWRWSCEARPARRGRRPVFPRGRAIPAPPRRAASRCAAIAARLRAAPAGPAACAVRRVAGPPAPRRSRNGANRASARICCSRPSSGRSRASASPMRVSTLRTCAAMSISCWLSLLRSWPIAAISALSFCCDSAALFCCGAGGFEFLLALLDGVGRSGGRLRSALPRPAPRPANRLRCRQSPRTTTRSESGISGR